jgi:hypothetical protein
MDTRSIEQRVNKAKASLEERRGPAGHSQRDTPILDALRRFHDDDTTSFAIPAHKSGMGAPAYVKEVLGEQAFLADQTMLNGVDNRHESWQVQTAAQNLAAEAFEADQCMFSTNGSTGSVHSAMSAVVGPGDKLAVSRNAHKSVITGLIHTGAIPVWLEPDYDEALEVAHGVMPDTLQTALSEHPDCRAVMIVSPTYYGVCSDVPGLAKIAHARDLPLVSDDAWALAYKFHPELPPFALDAGADLAIGSVHKTLSGLSQTSIISVKGSRIDTDRLSLSLEAYQDDELVLAPARFDRRCAAPDGRGGRDADRGGASAGSPVALRRTRARSADAGARRAPGPPVRVGSERAARHGRRRAPRDDRLQGGGLAARAPRSRRRARRPPAGNAGGQPRGRRRQH